MEGYSKERDQNNAPLCFGARQAQRELIKRGNEFVFAGPSNTVVDLSPKTIAVQRTKPQLWETPVMFLILPSINSAQKVAK